MSNTNRSLFSGVNLDRINNNQIISDDPGEILFYNRIKDQCDIIFDVGSSDNYDDNWSETTHIWTSTGWEPGVGTVPLWCNLVAFNKSLNA
jgi:hypothetical protein